MNAHLPRQSVSIQDDEWGTFCYTHHHIKATHRICSEADSFGAEYYNMCDECWDEYQAAIKAKLEDPEQWESCPKCRNHVPRLTSYRDPDEGMCGPVYEACPDCVSKFWKSFEDECEMFDDEYWD
mgnify:FL=1